MKSINGTTWNIESVPERLILKYKQNFKVSYLLSKILLEKKFRPKFTGSGKVIWQSPSPGTKKIPGTLCILGLN
mgnify:CR=1 FL=1